MVVPPPATKRRAPAFLTVLPLIWAGVAVLAAAISTTFPLLDAYPAAVAPIALKGLEQLRVPFVLVNIAQWLAAIGALTGAVLVRRGAQRGRLRWGSAFAIILLVPTGIGAVMPGLIWQTSQAESPYLQSWVSEIHAVALGFWACLPALITLWWGFESYGDAVGRGARRKPGESTRHRILGGPMPILNFAERRHVAEVALTTLRHRPHPRPGPGADTIQLVLPNNALFTLIDGPLGGIRRLLLMGGLNGGGTGRVIRRTLKWPKDTPQTGAWFSWDMTDRDEERALRSLEQAANMAFAGWDDQRLEGALVIVIEMPSAG